MFTDSVASPGSSERASNKHAYELLIYSLTLEDNKDDIDRKEKILGQWCRDSSSGIYIRDLPSVVIVLRILRELSISFESTFRETVSSVLSICSQPLLESRANERLRNESIQSINIYLLELVLFWQNDRLSSNIDLIYCLRSLTNGADDVDSNTFKEGHDNNNDGMDREGTTANLEINDDDISFVKLIDRSYMRTRLKESGTIKYLIKNFVETSDLLERNCIQIDMDINNEMITNDDKDKENTKNTKVKDINGFDDMKAKIQSVHDLLGSMTELMLDLSIDTSIASLLCILGLSNGLVKFLNAVMSSNFRDPKIYRLIRLLWILLDKYIEMDTIDLVKIAQSQEISSKHLGQLSSIATSDDNNSNTYNNTTHMSCQILDYEYGVNVLSILLKFLIDEGFKMADKECRNEILIILSMIAGFPVSIPAFQSSGLFTMLLSYSFSGDMGEDAWAFSIYPLANSRNYCSNHDIDIQFKRELWSIIVDIINTDDPDTILSASSSPFMDNLLFYIEYMIDKGVVTEDSVHFANTFANDRGKHSIEMDNHNHNQQVHITDSMVSEEEGKRDVSHSEYSPVKSRNINVAYIDSLSHNQLIDLKCVAATCLAELTPKTLGEFHRIDGPFRVLQTIRKLSFSNISEHQKIVYHMLLLLNRCIPLSCQMILVLEREDGINSLLNLFKHTKDDDIRTVVSRIISLLCTDNQICQYQLREADGIATFVNVLVKFAVDKRVMVKNHTDTNHQDELEYGNDFGGNVGLVYVAIIKCLNEGVIGNKKSEKIFAREEGIDALLNILEVTPHLMRIQILRFISDIIRNQKLLSFIFAWRSSKTMRNVVQLLTDVWIDEELRLNMSRHNGGIINIFNPLQIHEWPISNTIQLPGKSLSSDGSFENDAKSTIVSRLITAVEESRRNCGVVPFSTRKDLLASDLRCVIGNIFSLIGVIDEFDRNLPGIIYENDTDFDGIHFYDAANMKPKGDSYNDNFNHDGSESKFNPNHINNSNQELNNNNFNNNNNNNNNNMLELYHSLELDNDDKNVDKGNKAYFVENTSQMLGSSQGNIEIDSQTITISNTPNLSPREGKVLSLVKYYKDNRMDENLHIIKNMMILQNAALVNVDNSACLEDTKRNFMKKFTILCEHMELLSTETDTKEKVEKDFLNRTLSNRDQPV
jgi:hypothetical protein